MDLKPYKFDPHNPRIVTNVERPNSVYGVAAALFLGSLYVYNRKIFRIDQNALNFLLFTAGSAFASYQYANFFLNTPINEAGLLNN
jgi:hypothetical protein